MLPGDADAAVELDAVLDQLGDLRADPRLGHADELGGIVVAGRHGAGGGGGDGVAGLQRHLVVGHPVLERLVGGQGPAEGVAVAQVLEGELEDAVGRPDHLRGLQDARHLEEALHLVGGATGRPHCRGGRHGRTVEAHLGKAADQVEAAEGCHLHAREVGRHEQVAEALGRARHHQQVARLRTRLHRADDAVEREAVGRRHRVDGGRAASTPRPPSRRGGRGAPGRAARRCRAG